MPWAGYRWLTKGAIKAIYAYLRALPPISNAIPADFKDGLGLPAAVPFPTHFEQGDVRRRLPPDTVRIGPNSRRGLAIDPLRSPSDLGDDRAAFGRGSYLVDIAGCTHCHTHETTDSILAASEGDDPFTQRLHTEVFLTGGRLFKRVSPPLGVARALTADLIGETHGFFREPASTFDRFRAVIRSGTHADETPPRPLAPPMPWPIFRNMVDDDLLAVFTYLSLAPPRTGSADKAIQNYARFCQTAAACRAGEACFANPATGGVGECVGGICSNDLDCDACQACVTGQCQAPGVGDVCLATGR
jgi:hypothetical protein